MVMSVALRVVMSRWMSVDVVLNLPTSAASEATVVASAVTLGPKSRFSIEVAKALPIIRIVTNSLSIAWTASWHDSTSMIARSRVLIRAICAVSSCSTLRRASSESNSVFCFVWSAASRALTLPASTSLPSPASPSDSSFTRISFKAASVSSVDLSIARIASSSSAPWQFLSTSVASSQATCACDSFFLRALWSLSICLLNSSSSGSCVGSPSGIFLSRVGCTGWSRFPPKLLAAVLLCSPPPTSRAASEFDTKSRAGG